MPYSPFNHIAKEKGPGEGMPSRDYANRRSLRSRRFHPYASLAVQKYKRKRKTEKEEEDDDDDDDDQKFLFKKWGAYEHPVHTERAPRAASVPLPSTVTVYVNTSDVGTLSDLVSMIRMHPKKMNVEYVPDMARFHKALPHLVDLDAMVGLIAFKRKIVDQVVYYCQGLDGPSEEYRHMVLTGAPGTGKTEIAAILGRLYASLGILQKQTVHSVTRADLVAGYLGQTALKTREAVENALDGVLFIDEAYSLGGGGGGCLGLGGGEEGGRGDGGHGGVSDAFSVECLDTLCELLSRYRDRLVVIFAGYKDQLDCRVFQTNEGLRSRFMWWYDLPNYGAADLAAIFRKNVLSAGWRLEDEHEPENGEADDLVRSFDEHYAYFDYNGRDVVNFLTWVKIAHSRRLFANPYPRPTPRSISTRDIDHAFSSLRKEYVGDGLEAEGCHGLEGGAAPKAAEGSGGEASDAASGAASSGNSSRPRLVRERNQRRAGAPSLPLSMYA